MNGKTNETNNMKEITLIGSIFTVFLLFLSADAAAHEVYVDPPSSSVFINETFKINITASGDNITGLNFVLLFNNTVLEATNILKGPFFTSSLILGEGINNSAGKVNLSIASTGGPSSGTGAVVIITFKTKSKGTSQLDLEEVMLGNKSFQPIPGVIVTDGNATVSPVKVYVDPSTSTVPVNDTFDINITVSGNNITGADFQLLFNNTVLEATNMILGPFLAGATTIPDPPSGGINNSAGKIKLSSALLYPGVASGTGAVAIITFKAKSKGTSQLDLQNVSLTDNNNVSRQLIPDVEVTDGNAAVFIPPCGCNNGAYNYTCGQTVNESCTLNCNLTSNGTCFTIGASNITIDGNGFSITGNTSGNGINVTGRNNVTIKNFKIYSFSAGIYLSSSSNNTLTNNTANSNKYGIHLVSSDDNDIMNNNASSNTGRGVYLDGSSENNITDNTANDNNYYGISLESSSNNTLTNNIVNSNSRDGIRLSSSSSNNTVTNNTARLNNQDGLRIHDSGSTNNTITLNTFCSNNQSGGNYYDIYDSDSNSGDNNTCDTTYKWNDTGINGCWYACSGLPRICDLNNDGITIHDYNDLMTTYKCFLGITRNCDSHYQNWNLMEQEYACFIKNDI